MMAEHDSPSLRVLILNQYARPPGSAGITRHGDIGVELVRRGHQVSVIASDFDYFARRTQGGPARSVHDGVEFIWLRTGSYVANDQRRVRSLLRFAQASAWAAIRHRPRPDVIIGSSPNLLAGVAADVAARFLRRPWILEVRDFWPSALVDLGAIEPGSSTHRILLRVENRLYKDADAIVTVPPHGARRLQELGLAGGRCVHIPNGSALGKPPATELPEGMSTLLDKCRGKFLLVYAGAIGVTHDLPTALAAIQELNREPLGKGVALLLVGDGVAREETQLLAQAMDLPNVHFYPAVAKPSAMTVVRQAHACLMHAGGSDYFKYGLSPNKLFDYFGAGKPVLIASNNPTVVEEAGAGIRYRPGDPSALADAIRRMAALSEAERAEMGRRGRHLVETRYSIGAITDQYEALLEDVVARHRAR